MPSQGITKVSKKGIQIQNHLKNNPMLHNCLSERECYKIQGGGGGGLCIARPRRLGIAEVDQPHVSCSVTGIDIAVLIEEWKADSSPDHALLFVL